MAASEWIGEPLTAHERYFFDLYGYLIRYGALSDAELAAANAAVDRLQLAPAGTSIDSQRFTDFLGGEPIFRDLIDHESVLGALVDLCGKNVRLDHVYGIQMQGGTTGLQLHGGGTPHDPAQFYEVRDGRIFNGLVAVQWPLVDHGGGRGGFVCVPGSHRANFRLPDPVPDSWVVTVPLTAGDVVIFTEGLTHGTAPWTAEYPRRTLLYKYAPGHSAWSGQHQTTLAALRERTDLTPRQRLLLQPPSVGWHKPVTS